MDIEKRITVCPTDTDPYNIIHHPQYFIWTEEAILEWLISDLGNLNEISYEIIKFRCKFISVGVLYDELSLRLCPRGRKKAEGGEVIRFQVRVTNLKNKNQVIDGEFFVRVKEKINE